MAAARFSYIVLFSSAGDLSRASLGVDINALDFMFIHLFLEHQGYWKAWMLPDMFEEAELPCLLFLKLFLL